jgi:GMP synthase-like glutamine amidotransferase
MRIDIVQFDRDVSAGTYGRLLAARGVACRCLTPEAGPGLDFSGADALLLLGGHMGVSEMEDCPLLRDVHALLPELVAAGKPVLAICLGAQLLADALGGRATKGRRGERSVQPIALTGAGRNDPLFAGLPNPFLSFQWHNDSFDPPAAATHLAFTETCPGQAFRYRNAYGLQFHPEVDEPIIAGWCRRAGVDETPLEAFRASRAEQRQTSRRILENFLAMIGRQG